MKILLTGATGFIGSCLLPMLVEGGHQVVQLVRYTAGGRYRFYDRKDVVFADLRDRETVADVVHRVAPQAIIHLAAPSAVSFSFINPSDVVSNIVLGTISLAEAARQVQGLELFIHASSSEVYGSTMVHPTPETATLGATSPYAVAKIAAEEYLRVLHRSYGFPVLIMRPFNTYGRALVGNSHFVVERAITQALTQGRIQLHDPRPLREFIFRNDHVQGYVLAVAAYQRGVRLAGEAINLALGQAYSISEMSHRVAEIVTAVTGRPIEVDFKAFPDRPMDIPILLGDGSKARELLGWQPQFDLNAGLRQAVEEWQLVLNR